MTNENKETIKNLKKLKSFHNGSYGTTIDTAIHALEQQPCDDCISRKDAINVVHNYFEKYLKLNDDICLDGIISLPSVTPTKPKGKWVNNIHDIPICDQCGYMTPYDRAIDDYEYGNFCPNCGADMRGEENE